MAFVRERVRVVVRLISRLAIPAVLVAACSAGLADPASVSPDADLGQLTRAFSPCDGFDSVPNASGHLLTTASWLEVTELIDTPEGTGADAGPGVVEGLDNGAGQIVSRQVDAHWTYWPGMEWTVTTGGELWLGFARFEAVGRDDIVSVVVAFTRDGSAFFPGECQEAILGDPLRRFYGDGVDEILKQAVGTTGDELSEVLAEADRAGI